MAAPGPALLRVKRKREDDAPTALLVERQAKKDEEHRAAFGKDAIYETAYYYVRQTEESDKSATVKPSTETDTTSTPPSLFDAKHVQKRAEDIGSPRAKPRMTSGKGVGSKERRTFHLKRPSTPEAGIKKRKVKDGKNREDGMPTFYEKRPKRGQDDSRGQELLKHAGRARSSSLFSGPAGEEMPLKRPGRAVKTNGGPPSATKQHTRTDSQMEAIANSLHQYAVDEVSKQDLAPKPKLTSMPKLSGDRSRALHKQRASQTSILRPQTQDQLEDTSMDDDSDYVYDTYVLAPPSAIGAAQVSDPYANVGYLIITEEDQSLWETYMEEEGLSDEDPSDEDEDENAEDWYGADYPDDELASDDEFGRGAYGYRGNRGSDDEEYDEHTFSDDEYERQMNPWKNKTPAQFARYGARPLDSGGDDQDSE